MKKQYCIVVSDTIRNSTIIIIPCGNNIFKLWVVTSTVADCSCISVLVAFLYAKHTTLHVQSNKDKSNVTLSLSKQLSYHKALGQAFGKDGKPMASYLEKYLPPLAFVNDRILTAVPYSGPPPPNLPRKANINQDEEGGDDTDPDQHSRYPNYASIIRRRQTFTNWPHQSPSAQDMSQSGFFYTGHGDLVRCYKCGIGLKNFSSDDDDPLQLHAFYSPNCPFLCQMFGEDTAKRRLCSTIYLSLYKHQRNSRRENVRIKHPDYQSYRDRLNSFSRFPNNAVRPEQLAGAGFFYAGQGDQVRCFTCDGGLRSWENGDDPWIEHCRWFPNCPYVRHHWSEDFIAWAASVGTNDGFEDNEDANINAFSFQRTRSDPRIQALESCCHGMGYSNQDIRNAIIELINRGVEHPSLGDVLDQIDELNESEKRLTHLIENETPLDLNLRLKSMVFCQKCYENEINTLFLPCGHHKLCMSCANSLDKCPVCGRQIREKIRTYMA